MGNVVTTPTAGTASSHAALRSIRATVVAPFGRRTARELMFCLAGLPFLLANPLALFLLVVDLTWLITASAHGNPSGADIVTGLVCVGVLVVLLASTGAARRLGSWQRALAGRLLGLRLPPLPARRDGGWRAVAYLTLKLPVALLELYAVFFWVGGLVNLGYPLWWGAFRNHSAGVRLSPVPVYTPLGMFGDGTFRVATLPGTFAAAAAGVAMLLVAPWVARAVTSIDVWLIARLLGPGRLEQRVQDLERSRAHAVDDSAALLRRLERDLHDGAQIRLATLAMNLGMAREKLGARGEVRDADGARELIDAALRGTKDAIDELRSLARGIHPPVLDDGLADAVQSLAADSAIPVELEMDVAVRPTPAIETIAYFCVAELLANAAKHSYANTILVRATGATDVLTVSVTDDGVGGADATRGSGLSGLEQRVAAVDGRITVVSPGGGPTTIVVDLPMRA